MKKNLLFLLALALLGGCETVDEGLLAESGAVSFTNGGIQYTRVTDDQFDSGDAISVRALYEGVEYGETIYSYDGATFTSTTPFVLADGAALSYDALYPATATFDGLFAIGTDQGTIEGYEASDLLVARAAESSSSTPELTFNHVLSSIVLNVNVEENGVAKSGSTVAVTFNLKNSVAVDVANDSYEATGDLATITPYPSVGNGSGDSFNFSVIAAPQVIAANDVIASVTVDGAPFYFTNATDLTLLSSKRHIYTLTVDVATNETSVEFGGLVNGWDDVDGSVDDDFVLSYTIEQAFSEYENTLVLILSNTEFADGAVLDDMSKFELYWENDYEGASLLSGIIEPTSINVYGNLAMVVLPEPIYNTDRVWLYTKDDVEIEQVLSNGTSFSIPRSADANVITTYTDVAAMSMDFESEGEAEAAGWCVGTNVTGYSDLSPLYIAPDFFCENPMKTNYPTDFEAEWNDNKSDRCLMVDGSGDTDVVTLCSPTFSNSIVRTNKLTLKFQTYVDPSVVVTDGLLPTFNTLSSGYYQDAYNTWSTGGWIGSLAMASGAWQSQSVEITVEDFETDYPDLRLTMRFNGFHDIIYFDNFSFSYIEERPRE